MDCSIWRIVAGGPLVLALCTAMTACEPTHSTESLSVVGQHECTLAAYAAGLVLRFEGPGGSALPTATYEIVLDVDGDTYSLACGKPDDGSAFSCDEVEGSGDHQIYQENEFPDDRFFVLRIVRYADGGDFGPEQVGVTVVSGDATLVDATLEPTYERDEPNGEGCGLVDHQVEESVVIDAGGA